METEVPNAATTQVAAPLATDPPPPVDQAAVLASLPWASADDVEFTEYVGADSRSGEIEFRVQGPDSPATTVIVRQAGPDDHWSVVGAVSEALTVEKPTFDEDWDLGVVGTYHTIGGGGILRVYEEGSSTALLAACVPCGGTGTVIITGGDGVATIPVISQST